VAGLTTALPLGLFNDLVSGHPIGQSMALWTATFLLPRPRRQPRRYWRDYWMDWLFASCFILAYTAGAGMIGRLMGSQAEFASLAADRAFGPRLSGGGAAGGRARPMAADAMKRRAPPSSPRARRSTPSPAARFVLGGLQGGVAAALAGRMAYISIAENERYQLLSESNRVQMRLLPPRRGWIVDRTASRSRSTAATSASTSSPTG
jgi:hypothetical protein